MLVCRILRTENYTKIQRYNFNPLVLWQSCIVVPDCLLGQAFALDERRRRTNLDIAPVIIIEMGFILIFLEDPGSH